MQVTQDNPTALIKQKISSEDLLKVLTELASAPMGYFYSSREETITIAADSESFTASIATGEDVLMANFKFSNKQLEDVTLIGNREPGFKKLLEHIILKK